MSDVRGCPGYTGYINGCRCAGCREGNRVHKQKYVLKRLRSGEQRIPVEKAREIMEHFLSSGMNYRDVSTATGVSMDTLYGFMKQGKKYINKSTYDKLLDAKNIGSWRVDSEWCKKLERALMTMGWSQEWVALQVGYVATKSKNRRGRGPWHHFKQTRREYALKLLSVYIRHRYQQGPYKQSAQYAERNGYTVPIVLDEWLERDTTFRQLYEYVKVKKAS